MLGILDIGPEKLLIIMVIALVVVGPEKLPELARSIGRAVRQFQDVEQEIRGSLKTEEFDDIRREISDAKRNVREALSFPASGGKEPASSSGSGTGPAPATDEPSTPTETPESAGDAPSPTEPRLETE